jgi:predicted hydrolase (HD superfamily)
MQQHGVAAARMLKTTGLPDDICDIVQRHNLFLYTGTHDRPVEIALQAADSASDLIIACALVKDGRLFKVSAKTITIK